MAKRILKPKLVTADPLVNADSTPLPAPANETVQQTAVQKSQLTIDFMAKKKKEMKESQYRKRWDNLAEEIKTNLVNTLVSYGEKLYERGGWGSVMTYTKTAAGNTDMNVYPQKLSGRDQNRSGVPVSQEPIAFSKIITAASVLGGNVPDATVESDDKIYSKVAYELWRKTWVNPLANSAETLVNIFQISLTYGWAAWRVYPRRVETTSRGAPKIIFDDVYREAMDPFRTWLGVGFSNYDGFSKYEVYYEKDMPIDEFVAMYPAAKDNPSLLTYCSVSEEAKNENIEKPKTHVTIGYYENMILDRFVVTCGELPLYDGVMPNDEGFGSILVVRCFSRDANDPYGVGAYEMMRGNTAIYTYLNSLNAQQIEAEIFPLLFGASVNNGTATYKRGPNVVNPKTPGSTIDIIRTTGNVSGGIQFANQQKTDISENTGINNIVAGDSSDATLGGTVILAEAALKRLIIPRNSVKVGLELDAKITMSWIKQTYSVDKVYQLTSDADVKMFAKLNPDHFVQSKPITDDNDVLKGFMVLASPNLRLNFDFDRNGNLIEDKPTYKVSAKSLFDNLNNYGHTSSYICFTIDPTSMLSPSKEIEKQAYAAIFPLIQNQVTTIFALRMQDPEAAASQLKTFETMLGMFKQDIYNYISKEVYDDIMAHGLPVAQLQMQQINQQMNGASSGGAPAAAGAPVPSSPGMLPGGKPALQPVAPQSVPAPQSPMMAAADASLGYAAKMGGALKRV